MSKKNNDDLREELKDYFGTAMASGFPMARFDIAKVENASDDELRSIARKNGFDPERYDSDDE